MVSKVWRVLCVAVGVALVANALWLAAFVNIHIGVVAVLIGGLLFLFTGLFWRRWKRWIKGTLGIVTAVAALCVALLFVAGTVDNVTYCEDALIVLGAGIHGEEIPQNLQNRLDRAYAYYMKNPDAVIVVSGGQGPQETITEALAMERYLLKKGVPAEKVLKEERSTATHENFTYSKQLLDAHFHDTYTVAFVSNDYHIYRAGVIAAQVGFPNIAHCHSATPWYQILPNGLRECLAVGKLWIAGT